MLGLEAGDPSAEKAPPSQRLKQGMLSVRSSYGWQMKTRAGGRFSHTGPSTRTFRKWA